MTHWNYECPYCDPEDYDNYKTFFSVSDLAKHRDKEHTGNPIYICSACDKTFQDWWKATEHVFDEHDEYCDECQKGYLYEAVYLSPEDKERISEIHTEIAELKKELDTLCVIPTVQPSTTPTIKDFIS